MATWKTPIVARPVVEGAKNISDTSQNQIPTSYVEFESVQEYDQVEDLGKSANETILLGGIPVDPPPPPPPPESILQANDPNPSFSDLIASLKEKFDLTKFRKLVLKVFMSIPYGLTSFKQAFSALIVSFYYSDLTDPDAITVRQVIESQIQRYFAIPVTFWAALNWWYVLNYTNFRFNFTDALSLAPFKIGYYVFEPMFTVLEFMNYYMLSLRMDKKVSCELRNIINTLWDWRPISFTVFAFSMAGILHNIPFTSVLKDSITGDSNVFVSMMFIAIIFTYIYLTCTSITRLFSFASLLGNILVVIFVLLLFLLFVLIFSSMATTMAMFYLVFFSNLVLVVFERFNFPWKISEMLNDLMEAPVNDPDASINPKSKDFRPFTYAKQYVYRNFFQLMWAIVGVIPMIILNIVECWNMRNKAMSMAMMIVTVVTGSVLLAPVTDIIMKIADIVLSLFSGDNPFANPPPLDSMLSATNSGDTQTPDISSVAPGIAEEALSATIDSATGVAPTDNKQSVSDNMGSIPMSPDVSIPNMSKPGVSMPDVSNLSKSLNMPKMPNMSTLSKSLNMPNMSMPKMPSIPNLSKSLNMPNIVNK
jgi:hypothetical protein